jgi:transposase
VVRLGTQVVDEVRRRVQHDTLGHRGHKDDPLYKIRGLLRRGREHLTYKQIAKLNTGLVAGDPGWEVTLAWHCYQQLRSMYQAKDPADGRAIAERVIDSFPSCPIPEVARLGRTLRQWRSHVLARFDTHRISNGGTEAVNLIVEKTRRLAHGFRTFAHYRLCEYPSGWSGIGWQGWRRSPYLACDSYRLWPHRGCRDADMSALGGWPAPSRPTSVT